MRNEHKKQQWFDQGCPLEMEHELIKPEIRLAVKRNKSHKGKNRVLLMTAYNAIRKAMGQQPRRMDCSSCNSALNRQLQIWYRFYDARTPGQKKICARILKQGELKIDNDAAVTGSTESGDLVPLDQRRQVLEDMDYQDLLKRLEGEKPDRFKELVEANNGNRMLKKKITIKELLS